MADHIEITTAHNIVIKYELANVVTRIVANLIDITIMIVYGIFFGFLLRDLITLQYLIVFLPIVCYHLCFEIWNDGQSLGKLILNTKVVSLKGQSPSIEDVVMRWVFRLLDVTFTLGCLSIISILSTERNQRIGDVMAGTSIVKLRPKRKISLQDFDNMENIEHKVIYPQVTMYNDRDILLIKDALNQLRNHPNDPTRKVVKDLASIIGKDLSLKIKPSESKNFLKQVMNDYIILTR